MKCEIDNINRSTYTTQELKSNTRFIGRTFCIPHYPNPFLVVITETKKLNLIDLSNGQHIDTNYDDWYEVYLKVVNI